MKTPLALGSVIFLFSLAGTAHATTALDLVDSDSITTSDDEIPAQARDVLRELLSREADRRPAIDGPPIYSDDPKEMGMLSFDYSDEVPPMVEPPVTEIPAQK